MISRPATRERGDSESSSSARFYLCVRCYSRALVCSSCDRGQIYCTPECAREGRKERQRSARQRYQAGTRGRAMHAERSRRFRARRRSVTDHSSRVAAPETLQAVSAAPPRRRSAFVGSQHFVCNGCACAVSEFFRRDTLARPKRARRSAIIRRTS